MKNRLSLFQYLYRIRGHTKWFYYSLHYEKSIIIIKLVNITRYSSFPFNFLLWIFLVSPVIILRDTKNSPVTWFLMTWIYRLVSTVDSIQGRCTFLLLIWKVSSALSMSLFIPTVWINILSYLSLIVIFFVWIGVLNLTIYFLAFNSKWLVFLTITVMW